MLVFGTQIHIVTFIFIVLEAVMLLLQTGRYLFRPEDKHRGRYSILLFLLIVYDFTRGLIPDTNLPLPIPLQHIISYGAGFITAAYFPFYFYKEFDLHALRWHATIGVQLFLLLPYLLFFVLLYLMNDNFVADVRIGIVIPFIYAIILLRAIFAAIHVHYEKNRDHHFYIEEITVYCAVSPWVAMGIFVWFQMGQVTEILCTNIGFVIITGVFFVKSAKRARLEEKRKHTLEKLIDELGNVEPSTFDQLKISDFSLPFKAMHLKELFKKLKLHLKDMSIDQSLREMLYGSLFQYIRKKGLTAGDFNYIKVVINYLLAEQQITTKRLMELLVILDLNIPELLLYYVEHWQKKVLGIDSLHDQLEITIRETDQINFLTLNIKLRRPGATRPLSEELGRYLREKREMISQLIVLRREFLKDQKEAMDSTRFQINLPVAQLGLFIRLLLERGILLKENLGELFSFFAAHFYTPKTLYISAESLQKKSSDVEFSTALKLKGILIAMLNYLNANFNLSNYNG
jgi:hypothetical protein